MTEWDELLQTYGSNSNAFLTTYPGFRLFTSPEVKGAIVFFETRFSWIGTTEPLAPLEAFEKLVCLFQQEARKQNKSILFIPVGETFADILEENGFGKVMIGAEPYFDLLSRNLTSGHLTKAKHLAETGARVEEFRPEAISFEERNACDEIIEQWMESRRIPPLGFVNRVMPWKHAHQKKYFWVKRQGKLLALLSAVPIPAEEGWYFVDLFRFPDSPAGSTELLILEAMTILKKQGYKTVSLGVSPLSNLEQVDFQSHPILYPVLLFVFHSFNLFYRFKPLYNFKLKFCPTLWRPSYLLYPTAQLTLRQSFSLMEAFLPHGLMTSFFSFIVRSFHRGVLFTGLEKVIADDILFLPPPRKSARELVNATKFSLGFGLAGLLLPVTWPIFLGGFLASSFIEVFSGGRLLLMMMPLALLGMCSLDGLALSFIGGAAIMLRKPVKALFMISVMLIGLEAIYGTSWLGMGRNLLSIAIGALTLLVGLRAKTRNQITISTDALKRIFSV